MGGREGTPRTIGEDLLSNLLTFSLMGEVPSARALELLGFDANQFQALQELGFGPGTQTNFADIIQQQLTAPQFGGPLSAGMTGLQQQGLAGATQGTDLISSLFGPTGAAQSSLNALMGIGQGQQDFLPPELRAAFGMPQVTAQPPPYIQPPAQAPTQATAGPGGQVAQQQPTAGAGPGLLSMLLGSAIGGGMPGAAAGAATTAAGGAAAPTAPPAGGGQPPTPPTRFNMPTGGLTQLPGMEQLMGIATGEAGLAPDLAKAFETADVARRTGLGRDIRDIREMFSAGGLRFSTDLANEVAARQAESEQGFQAGMFDLIARTAPQLAAQRGAAAGGAAQLGLGQTGQIANLFGGGQQQQLQALMGAPGVAGGFGQLPLAQSQALFGLGEQQRGIADVDRQRQLAEFARTQGGLLQPLLSFFSGTPQIVSPGVSLGPLGTVGK